MKFKKWYVAGKRSRPGTQPFTMVSDDGSRLYIINDKLVVDNDGTSGPTRNQNNNLIEGGTRPSSPISTGRYGDESSPEGPGFAKREISSEALYTVGGGRMVPLSEQRSVLVVDP